MPLSEELVFIVLGFDKELVRLGEFIQECVIDFSFQVYKYINNGSLFD